MVIDSSALLAIVLGEPDAEVYIEAIDKALAEKRPLYVPASAVLEAAIVADTRDRASILDVLLDRLQPEVIPFDRSLAGLARQIFRRFGRGRHRAQLNFGDCMSYATAEYLRMPLLFKGQDFRHTTIESAL